MKRTLGCLVRGVVLIALIAVIAAAAAAFLGDSGDGDATPTPDEVAGVIQGTLEITDGEWDATAEGCIGIGAWSDIQRGAEIEFADAVNPDRVEATTLIADGLMYEDEGGVVSCMAAFEAPILEADVYQITVGSIVTECDASRFYESDGGLLVALELSGGGITCKDLAGD